MDLCQLCTQHDAMGGYLCPGCTKDTVARLDCLPSLYEGLLSFLAPSMAVSQGRAGKGGPAPLPVRAEILDLRGPGGMVGVVEDWLSAVRLERGMRQPTPAGSVEGRLKAAVAGLIVNMPWIAVSWPQAGTFAEEIRALTRSASSIVSPAVDEVRGTRVGTCPAQFDDGGVCGAVLRLLPGEQVVTCSWCGTSYPPATWVELKVLIDKDTRARNAA
ncbi:hypothetical protein ACFYY2_17505 [Streptomyces sp. NPDC001822]|uniref:hypothetical protein n=1 Tax=Streptomyces sp. NPDC001822 TaxID=3364614 RepID=UPI003697AAE3